MGANEVNEEIRNAILMWIKIVNTFNNNTIITAVQPKVNYSLL